MTELLEGGTLADYIGGAPWTAAQARGVAAALLRACADMHAAGVAHRDLKPDNIVYRSGAMRVDNFAVIDYGLCCGAWPGDRAFDRCGTPGYVAPEVSAGRADGYDATKADVYAVGCIIFELLCGRAPWASADERVLMHLHQWAPLSFAPGVDATARALVERLMCRDPEQRPSALDALDDVWILDL